MKRLFSFGILLCISAALLATSVPTDYYAEIEGLQDSLLKSTLSMIIRGGVRYEYGNNSYHTSTTAEWTKGDLKAYGTWQALPLTDRRPEDGTVWDMYSNSVRYFPNKQGESACSMNIEHCLPKSWWGGTLNEAYKDLYNLNPSDQRANQQKSNYAPGHVTKGDKFDNGSFRMDVAKSSRYGYIVYEPAEEYRGDFARTYFYMATAYEYLDWSASYAQYISNDHYTMFSDSIIQVLLDWHRADPVSDKEICRAEQIFAIQGNRNAFIDYPDLVEYIWGNKKGQSVSLSALTCTASRESECESYNPDPVPDAVQYDTILSLPALTAALVKAVPGGYANAGIQSNGSASITMGKSATDGYISFSGLTITDSTYLSFRASPYNTASSMQLMVYVADTLLQQIDVEVENETRNEVRYVIPLPVGADSITIASVGGGTAKRACMQELYIVKQKPELTPIDDTPETPQTGLEEASFVPDAYRKILRNGHIVIVRQQQNYTIYGTRID